eukprot:g4160.t1
MDDDCIVYMSKLCQDWPTKSIDVHFLGRKGISPLCVNVGYELNFPGTASARKRNRVSGRNFSQIVQCVIDDRDERARNSSFGMDIFRAFLLRYRPKNLVILLSDDAMAKTKPNPVVKELALFVAIVEQFYKYTCQVFIIFDVVTLDQTQSTDVLGEVKKILLQDQRRRESDENGSSTNSAATARGKKIILHPPYSFYAGNKWNSRFHRRIAKSLFSALRLSSIPDGYDVQQLACIERDKLSAFSPLRSRRDEERRSSALLTSESKMSNLYNTLKINRSALQENVNDFMQRAALFSDNLVEAIECGAKNILLELLLKEFSCFLHRKTEKVPFIDSWYMGKGDVGQIVQHYLDADCFIHILNVLGTIEFSDENIFNACACFSSFLMRTRDGQNTAVRLGFTQVVSQFPYRLTQETICWKCLSQVLYMNRKATYSFWMSGGFTYLKEKIILQTDENQDVINVILAVVLNDNSLVDHLCTEEVLQKLDTNLPSEEPTVVQKRWFMLAHILQTLSIGEYYPALEEKIPSFCKDLAAENESVQLVTVVWIYTLSKFFRVSPLFKSPGAVLQVLQQLQQCEKKSSLRSNLYYLRAEAGILLSIIQHYCCRRENDENRLPNTDQSFLIDEIFTSFGRCIKENLAYFLITPKMTLYNLRILCLLSTFVTTTLDYRTRVCRFVGLGLLQQVNEILLFFLQKEDNGCMYTDEEKDSVVRQSLEAVLFSTKIDRVDDKPPWCVTVIPERVLKDKHISTTLASDLDSPMDEAVKALMSEAWTKGELEPAWLTSLQSETVVGKKSTMKRANLSYDILVENEQAFNQRLKEIREWRASAVRKISEAKQNGFIETIRAITTHFPNLKNISDAILISSTKW